MIDIKVKYLHQIFYRTERMGGMVSSPREQYFSYIVAVSFIDGGNRVSGENHRHVTSQ